MKDNINSPAPLPLGRESIVTLNSKLGRSRPGLDTFEKGQIASPAWNRDAFPLTSNLVPLPNMHFLFLKCIVIIGVYVHLQSGLSSARPDF